MKKSAIVMGALFALAALSQAGFATGLENPGSAVSPQTAAKKPLVSRDGVIVAAVDLGAEDLDCGTGAVKV